MVNVYNRYTSMRRIWRPILIGGIAPAAPINHLAMLHDYIGPRQRYITCPSQDLIYGFGILDLGREPVVVQVPDFGERFWVYRRLISESTLLPSSAPCTARRPASICSPVPAGVARSLPASQRPSAPRRISAPLSRASSRRTRALTTKRCSR
jgi:hypothetical protein